MPTLHVRNVPEDLYARIKGLAERRSLSLSAEVIDLLHSATKDRETRMRSSAVLDSIRRNRFAPPRKARPSLELLREDRDR